MAEKNEILRSIPKMDELLRLSVLAELNAAQASITEAARETVENFRPAAEEAAIRDEEAAQFRRFGGNGPGFMSV